MTTMMHNDNFPRNLQDATMMHKKAYSLM